MVDRIGQQLGNYRLIKKIGEGGFAEVYLGEHIHLGTQAALKVLHTQLAEEEVEAFRVEARTIARLVHSNIVRILDFGVEGKLPFLVMDYAPNGTLRQRHPGGMLLPLPQIVSYVKQVADALQYAHDQRLIHRDIKPANMLVGRLNEILLSDFGIALVAQTSRHQSTQDIIGTAAYMSPEQLQGKPRAASDQYSLGIAVYEWISGDRPFHGSFAELYAQHMFTPPPSLREKVPMLQPEVENVVLTALAKDPHHRFDSIRAFAAALEQANGLTAISSTFRPSVSPSPNSSVSLPSFSSTQPVSPRSLMNTTTFRPTPIRSFTMPPRPPTPLQDAAERKAAEKAAEKAAKRGQGFSKTVRDIFSSPPPLPENDAMRMFQDALNDQGKGNLAQSILTLQEICSRGSSPRKTEANPLLQKVLRQYVNQTRKSGNWEEEIVALEELAKFYPSETSQLQTAQTNLRYATVYEGAGQLLQTGDISTAKQRLQYLRENAPSYGDPAKLAANISIMEIEKQHQSYAGAYEEARQLLQTGDISTARQRLQHLWKNAPLYGDPANLASRAKMNFRKIEKKAEQIHFIYDPSPEGLGIKPGDIWWSVFFLLVGLGSFIGIWTQSSLWAGGTGLLVVFLLYVFRPYRVINPFVTLRIFLLGTAISCCIGWYGSQIKTSVAVYIITIVIAIGLILGGLGYLLFIWERYDQYLANRKRGHSGG